MKLGYYFVAETQSLYCKFEFALCTLILSGTFTVSSTRWKRLSARTVRKLPTLQTTLSLSTADSTFVILLWSRTWAAAGTRVVEVMVRGGRRTDESGEPVVHGCTHYSF